MANNVTFTGVNYNNLRKALYLMFFGTDNGKCNDFSTLETLRHSHDLLHHLRVAQDCTHLGLYIIHSDRSFLSKAAAPLLWRQHCAGIPALL